MPDQLMNCLTTLVSLTRSLGSFLMIFTSLAREFIKCSSSKTSEKLLKENYKIQLSENPIQREKAQKKNNCKSQNWKYLVSCQNDLLSSSGITRVAFIIRATATISHICSKGKKSSGTKYNGKGHSKLTILTFHGPHWLPSIIAINYASQNFNNK